MIKINLIKIRNKQAFSFLELMIASAILMFIIIGLLYTYIACFELNEFNRNLTFANNALQAEMESLRETPFDDLPLLDGTSFTLDGFPSGSSTGFIDIYATPYADLMYVRLVGCWSQKSGRIIGEDRNLDGTLQPSEDLDLDNVMDSPAEIATFISRIE